MGVGDSWECVEWWINQPSQIKDKADLKANPLHFLKQFGTKSAWPPKQKTNISTSQDIQRDIDLSLVGELK
jgi:hypothetical protein